MGIISNSSVIKKQGSNFKKLDKQYLLEKILMSKKKEILDAQRNQLQFGIGKDGKKIKPEYSDERYAIDKQAMNPLPGKYTPDLYYSGDLYKSLDFELLTDKSYVIFSEVDYFSKLDEKYTTAFDLSKKSAQSIGVQNEYFNQVHKAINK